MIRARPRATTNNINLHICNSDDHSSPPPLTPLTLALIALGARMCSATP
eukprot:SAG11_NODE_21069_length_432_cov_4.714715_1_plen_48_part_01